MTTTAKPKEPPKHAHRWIYFQMDATMSAEKGFPMEIDGKQARKAPAYMAVCYAEYAKAALPGCGTTKFETDLPPGYVAQAQGFVFSKSELDREVEETAGIAQEDA